MRVDVTQRTVTAIAAGASKRHEREQPPRQDCSGFLCVVMALFNI